MPATVKATLKAEARADKTHAVRIRITTDRKPRYHNTGIFVLKSHWNPKATYEKENWIRNSHHEFDTYNNSIVNLIDQFKDIALKNPHLDAEEIIQYYHRPKQEKQNYGFVAYAKEYIQRKRDISKPSTADVYLTCLNRYLAFAGKNPDDHKFLTVTQITRFLLFMRDKKGYTPASCNFTIEKLSTIYKKGVWEQRIPMLGDPFSIDKLPIMEDEKPRPEESSILNLAKIKPNTPGQLHSRNALLMLYFIGGARVSEAVLLEWDKNIKPGYIEYLPRKKAKKLKRVVRHAGIEWVLDQYPRKGKYVFPWLNEDEPKTPEDMYKRLKSIISIINRHFKEYFAKPAGITGPVSTRALRRAYTDAALETSGDVRMAQFGVGHSSLTTTEIYTKDPMQKKLDEMNQSIFSGFGEIGKHQENIIPETIPNKRTKKPRKQPKQED